jgi:L-asparaginase
MKIAIINTGGTISCVGKPLAPMSASDFASASEEILTPILKQQFPNVEVTYLTNVAFPESSSGALDSCNFQPTDWCIMATAILSHYADYDAFLVLHGTDSMAFTGSALPFLLNTFDENGVGTAVLSKPIIITGSQAPLYYKDSSSAALSLKFNTDAYQNVCGALASARTGIPEVCVYFHHQLFRGNRAIKTHTSEFDAFSSPNYPALAEHGVELDLLTDHWLPSPLHHSVSLDNPTVLDAQQAVLEKIAIKIDNYPIAQLNAFPAHYSQNSATAYLADIITAIANTGVSGLILESYGTGNFPSGNPDSPHKGAIYQALKKASDSGINLVACSQVVAGAVNNSVYAAGAWLPQTGTLSPSDMTPICALVKLMILSTLSDINNWSRGQLRELFQTNLAGEMRSVNNLDSRTDAVLMPGQSIATLDGSAILMNDQKEGPVLCVAGAHAPLWKLPSPPASSDMPGRLIMQDNGNLVFYSRCNKALWASNTGNLVGGSSKLLLGGHYNADIPSQSTLLLQVYNYSSNTCATVLFQSL